MLLIIHKYGGGGSSVPIEYDSIEEATKDLSMVQNTLTDLTTIKFGGSKFQFSHITYWQIYTLEDWIKIYK